MSNNNTGLYISPSKNELGCGNSFFNLLEYDCIGFDLDNTLCEYNVLPSIEMEYNCLAKHLVDEKGFDPNYLLKPLDNSTIDFLHKGLLADFENGNLLKIGENGVVCRASHGTTFMTDKDIIRTYGDDKKCKVTSEFCEDMLNAWNGPLSGKVRAFLDYFDMPASLAFARIIDSIDYQLGGYAESYNVWPDILDALHYMYKREHFSENKGNYFEEIKSNTQKFIKKCSPTVVNWLKEIKRTKITYLVTGSNSDFASLTAEWSLGKDWQNLFDVVVFYARKPGFFTDCRPFIKLEGLTESHPISPNEISLGNMYSQGNWQGLCQMFAKKLNKEKPKCLYFGDNLIQDVFTPSKYTKCDTVAVVEELWNDKSFVGGTCGINSKTKLTNNSWGSYFFEQNQCLDTFWGKMIKNHAKLCIPSLSVLTQYPLKHQFKMLRNGPVGFVPVSLDVCQPEELSKCS